MHVCEGEDGRCSRISSSSGKPRFENSKNIDWVQSGAVSRAAKSSHGNSLGSISTPQSLSDDSNPVSL